MHAPLQARLELEVQRLSGELSASERKLELTALDLAAERDRVVAQAGLLERKVRRPFAFKHGSEKGLLLFTEP